MSTSTNDPRGTKRQNALPGTRGNVFFVPRDQLAIVWNHKHPLYDARVQDPLSDEFVASIRDEGVRSPLWVAKVDGFASPVIIAGKQRWRAAESIGIEALPCLLVKGDIPTLYKLMILENEHRRDDTQSAKAEKTRRFVEIYGKSEDTTDADAIKQAALAFGVSTKTVEARLRFGGLSPVVQQACDAGQIGFWAATELADIPAAKQQEVLQKTFKEAAAEGKKPSIETAKRAAGKGKAVERDALEKAREKLAKAAVKYANEVGKDAKPDLLLCKEAIRFAAVLEAHNRKGKKS